MNSCYGKCLLKPIDTETKYIGNSGYKDFVSSNYNWVKECDYNIITSIEHTFVVKLLLDYILIKNEICIVPYTSTFDN